jgi:hypothetical protein
MHYVSFHVRAVQGPFTLAWSARTDAALSPKAARAGNGGNSENSSVAIRFPRLNLREVRDVMIPTFISGRTRDFVPKQPI